MAAKLPKKIIHIACDSGFWAQLDEMDDFQLNLKDLTTERFEQLKKEIVTTGFAFAIHVWKDPKDKRWKTIGGHQRRRVVGHLVEKEGYVIEGGKGLPIVPVKAKTIEEARRRVLQDIAEFGQVTSSGLHEFTTLAGIDFADLSSSFSIPGIDMPKFEAEFFDVSPAGNTDEDDVPEPPKNPVSKRGQIWQLGDSRMACGDSTDVAHLTKLMRDDRADLLATDPPYGVSYVEKNAAVHGGVVKNAIGKKIDNDSLDVDGMFQLWCKIFNAAQFFNDKASYYVFSPQGGELMMMMMMQAIHQSPWQLKHTLIWAKQNFVFGRSDYHYQHEPILYGWKKKGTHNWFGDRKQSSVLQFDKAQRNDLHPTCKPVALMEYLLGNSSETGSLVVDLFGGSGSTLIAAQKMGRRCYISEQDLSYCDVIIERWQQFTGQKAKLLKG